MITPDYCELSYHFCILGLISHMTAALIIFLVLFFHFKKVYLRIFVVETEQECEKVCEIIGRDCSVYRVLGIDAEWITIGKSRQPIALIQICSPKGTCGLFRVNILKKIPPKLKMLLENKELIKVGVVPEKDGSLLFNDYGIMTKSTLDLRHLSPNHLGLAGLAKEILNVVLDKNYKVRCSNWEIKNLSEKQINYAAMDVYVAIEIFKKLTGIEEPSFINKFWKKNVSWQLIEGRIIGHLDQKFNMKTKISCGVAVKSKNMTSNKNLKKLSRFSIKKPNIYDNCYMRAPDGTLLCTLRKEKAQWYLNKGKAQLILEDPYTIKLLFEPKKKPSDIEHLYEKDLKMDICVVCGTTVNLLKHCVVPRMYTKHFPVSLKSHRSHDILLFCVRCHLEASQRDRSLMEQLEKMAGCSKEKSKKAPKMLGNFAKALLNHRAKLPETRRIEMEEEIKRKYNVQEISDHLLTEIVNEKPEQCGAEVSSSGLNVVEYFCRDGRTIFEFQRLWRQQFVSTMYPEYLPKHWSVDHEN